MSPRAVLVGFIGVLAVACASTSTGSGGERGGAAGESFDVLIQNGLIVDGSGSPGVAGSLAIRGDRIVALGPDVSGPANRVIDAKGLVIAPGFIDQHSHSDFVLFEDGNAESKIRQGVTTDVIGEGSSAGPYKGKVRPHKLNVRGQEREIRTLGDYFTALEDAGTSINVVSYVGIGNLRESVLGSSFAKASPADLAAMKELAAEAMRDGAVGFSTQLMMPPGSLFTTDEIAEIAKAVKPYGGIYSSHIRTEGDGVFDAVKEAIAIGEKAHVPVDVIHLKIADQKRWGRMKEILGLIEAARARGVDVQCNVYPYTRGNNNLSSIIPPWAHEGGRQQMLARLKDRSLRARLKKDISEGVADWYNHYLAVGKDWSRMLIADNNPESGKTMDQVLKARAQQNPKADTLDLFLDYLAERGGGVSTVYAHHTEEDMNAALQFPLCSIGSDGSALATTGALRRGNPHPRNFGTFPRVLGVYVRERKLLTLEDAVRKMSALNARKLNLADRGLLRAGAFADVTLFDPRTVIDRSTYTEPFAYNEGISYVIVNGEVVLDQGRHTGKRPGRALRWGGRPRPAAPPVAFTH